MRKENLTMTENLESPYKFIAVRDNPQYLDQAAEYFSRALGLPKRIYDDCIGHSISTQNPLPRWYIMQKDEQIIGCFGLITNDFNSRQDLCPWLAALYIEESERGQALGSQLLAHGLSEARKLGFPMVYLATDHVGYYEKYGWTHLGTAYGIDDESRIYAHKT
jgi:GNAT superfamily N-acetyltransferase